MYYFVDRIGPPSHCLPHPDIVKGINYQSFGEIIITCYVYTV